MLSKFSIIFHLAPGLGSVGLMDLMVSAGVIPVLLHKKIKDVLSPAQIIHSSEKPEFRQFLNSSVNSNNL
jgi:hypothetical protein